MIGTTFKKAMAGGALVLSGLTIGGLAAGNNSASATTTAVSSTVSSTAQNLDPTKSMRSDEQLLTGTTAAKVKAAALAKYPGATVQRVETDSDGVYEAHIVTAAGDHVIVQVGKGFAVSGTQTGGGPRGSGAVASQSSASA